MIQRIHRQLPAELVGFMELAGQTAARMNLKLYLVGGVVRDLLLERSNLDLDLVVECDAIRLAEEMAKMKNGRVIAHGRFNTAKVRWDKWSVDFATARGETYERPGALPTIQPCEIKADLIRRDFTINAMAVCLMPDNYGELIDLYHGCRDLENKIIRILHENSFKDDATRMWRAVRYEQRLDFRIEPQTLEWLKRDISYLDTISGDRIRHELELCLEEEKPEKVLLRAGELGILARIHPALHKDEELARKMSRARGRLQPYTPPRELYLAFLFYRLTEKDLEQVISRLNFSRSTARILQDTIVLRDDLPSLAAPELPLSRVYHCLHQYSATAILANLLASSSPAVHQRIESYLNNLRHIQPSLTGEDLVKMGIASGPRIREILDALREARLDGIVRTREEELEMARQLDLSSRAPQTKG